MGRVTEPSYVDEMLAGLMHYGGKQLAAVNALPTDDAELSDSEVVLAACQTFSQELERPVWVVCARINDAWVPLAVVDEQLIDGLSVPTGLYEVA